MRQPASFPPLAPEADDALRTKIEGKTLDYPDLAPLIAHLAYRRPRVVVLTPAADRPAAAGRMHAAERGLLWRFACAAMHDAILRGELPTAPVIKYCPEVLDPQVPHELALRAAAACEDILRADAVVLYADCGHDDAGKAGAGYAGCLADLIGFARCAGKTIEVRALDLPEGWGGHVPGIAAEAARRWIETGAAGNAFGWGRGAAALTAARLGAGALDRIDVADAAALLHSAPHVVVESPFAPRYAAADGPALSAMDREINVALAQRAVRKHLLLGEPASASHAEFTFEGILDDTVTHQRVLGIACGLAKTLFDDVTRLYEVRDMSSGMQKGIEFAQRVGRPILHGGPIDLPMRFWRTMPSDLIVEEIRPHADAFEATLPLMFPDAEDTEGWEIELSLRCVPEETARLCLGSAKHFGRLDALFAKIDARWHDYVRNLLAATPQAA